LLQAALGDGRVVARPGDRRLVLLDPPAAALWELHASGLPVEALAGLVAERFGLAEETADAQVGSLVDGWLRAGLLNGEWETPREWRFEPSALVPPLPAPVVAPSPAGAWRLSLAELSVSLEVDFAEVERSLAPLLAPLREGGGREVLYRLEVRGDPDRWTLEGNGTPLESGKDADGAVVATLRTLTELGCGARERMLVVHGAALMLPDGRGLLLVARGGSGKTTLAAALNSNGMALLSDDVVPVTPDGRLVGLGLPLCVKPGSFPVLAAWRPDLERAPSVMRLGQPVRFLPARGPRVAHPVAPGLLLFPSHRPGEAPRVESLTPAQVLRGVVEAESVIRGLTQTKLEALARWVGMAPAYSVTYPDLETGLDLVDDLQKGCIKGASREGS
jgi:hypothetical protein